MKIQTLKNKQDFNRVFDAKSSFSSRSFVIYSSKNPLSCDDDSGFPNFGFIITKKIGNSVVRNRIRRRIKGALAILLADRSFSVFCDYVIIARRSLLDEKFTDIVESLRIAISRLIKKNISLQKA